MRTFNLLPRDQRGDLGRAPIDGGQQHAAGERQSGEQKQRRRKHRQRQPRHQPGAQELGDHHDAAGQRQAEKEQRQQAEEGHRLVVAEEGEDGEQDAVAVPVGVQLAGVLARSRAVAYRHLGHREALHHGLQRQLGLDLEPLRSEEHTSELQSRQYLVCRLLLEKKKKISLLSFYLKKKKQNSQN